LGGRAEGPNLPPQIRKRIEKKKRHEQQEQERVSGEAIPGDQPHHARKIGEPSELDELMNGLEKKKGDVHVSEHFRGKPRTKKESWAVE